MADLVDSRQRKAAVLLLAAIDLPAPMDQVARAWIAASEVWIGATADLVTGGRRHQLLRARALIDEVLADLPEPATAEAAADV